MKLQDVKSFLSTFFPLLCLLAMSVLWLNLAWSEEDPWETQPASYWMQDFSGTPRDDSIALPKENLELEGIGAKRSVFGVFDHWDLNEKATGGRSSEYANVTEECKGLIEPNYALTAEEWANPDARKRHFQDLDELMDRVGRQLLKRFHAKFSMSEETDFLRALHALAWQETHWENYIRYKDWFFVVLSGGTRNKLEDWGITQVSRSSLDPLVPTNSFFFASKGYCSIGSTLFYGFMEFYFTYQTARNRPCNQGSNWLKILGAYNQYSSGVSSCYNEFSKDPDFAAYQGRALGGYTKAFTDLPWKL